MAGLCSRLSQPEVVTGGSGHCACPPRKPNRRTALPDRRLRWRQGAGTVKVPIVMSESDVLRVLRLLAHAPATVWVDGGWGVDALVGVTTRAHSDLDLVVLSDELDIVRTSLRQAGFTEVLRDLLPTALAVGDGAGREIDLHPVVGCGGGGYQILPGGQRFRYPPPVTGVIGGHEVQCVDAATKVQCHLGYEPTEKDRRDMARLQASTGVVLPGEYLRKAE